MPEVLAGSKDYGPPADIFAFGMLLSELDTHMIPYDDARGVDNKKPLANVAILPTSHFTGFHESV